MTPLKKQLYQVFVHDTEQKMEVPIGPAMDNPEALFGLAEKVNLASVKGSIKGWRDAHVVPVQTQGA